MEDKKHEKELKELSQVIVDALTRNEDVMGMIADLREKRVIKSSTLLGLALKVNDLLEISGTAISQTDDESVKGKIVTPKKSIKELIEPKLVEKAGDEASSVYIDGVELSPSETEFQKWVSDHFDENEWMKQAGIIW